MRKKATVVLFDQHFGICFKEPRKTANIGPVAESVYELDCHPTLP